MGAYKMLPYLGVVHVSTVSVQSQAGRILNLMQRNPSLAPDSAEYVAIT